ncbi:MAG TPA: TolC family protein [Chitinophagaceae bacterium]|nr:TolC family protein [Chitinophagaceae bacterium]
MVNKRILLIFGLLVFRQAVAQQRLTLSAACEMAQKNYPAIKQKELVKQTALLTIENLQKIFLPQVAVGGQATYQSDVTKVSIPVTGFSIEPLSKDQYKLVADVSQLVYDGGLVRQQKAAQQLNAQVEDQQVAVELYQLRSRISQLYISILYMDEQLKQAELVKSDLQAGIDKVQALLNNGVAYKSDLDLLHAELLKADQRSIELQATRKGLLATMSLFLGQPLEETTILEIPSPPSHLDTAVIRPELQLYRDQSALLQQQHKLIQAKNRPKASLFVQGGYGRPGLNMLKNEFAFYYLGGLRLNWSLGGLYTRKKEQELVEVSRKMIEVQKETFLLNTNSQLKQQQAEIDKWRQLVASDDAILALRSSVKAAAKARLDNGVMTANDYLREVNAEDQARQAKIAHELQLLQAQINYQTIAGG